MAHMMQSIQKVATKVGVHPEVPLGYVSLGTIGGAHLMSALEVGSAILQFLTLLIGLIVGLYTLRIQRRKWKSDAETK